MCGLMLGQRIPWVDGPSCQAARAMDPLGVPVLMYALVQRLCHAVCGIVDA